jgi:hypothetical protein
MMGKVGFDVDGKYLPAASLALYQTATMILMELAREKRGDGAWFGKLRRDIELAIKNMDMKGMPFEAEPPAVEASLAAIAAVFDRITFGGQMHDPALD